MTISLLEWDVTYEEFSKWATDNKVDVYAVAAIGGAHNEMRYIFVKSEDLAAFKLTFSKSKNSAPTRLAPYIIWP